MNLRYRRHGVMTPGQKGNVPARVINIQSRKGQSTNNKIRLDRLFKAEVPVICIKRRLGGIGDVLMTTPLLKAIKELIPHCHLIYATDLKYANGALGDVIRHNPYVDELISNDDFGKVEYDYTVDITRTGLSAEKPGSVPPNRIDMFADEVGVSIEADPVPVYVTTEKEKEWAIKYLESNILQGSKREDIKIFLVQVRSNDARRTWPLDYMQTLCDMLSEKEDHRVLLYDWGKTAERWKGNKRLFVIKDERLPNVASIMEQVNMVVCPDSSLLHLAGALSKKIVTVFGPIPPESRINHYINATSVTIPLHCSPCWYSPKCTKQSGSKLDCLTKLEPELVFDTVMKKLKEPLKINSFITYGKDLTNKGQDSIILVKRLSKGLGDIMMATTGIEALKKKYPLHKIHVAVQKEEMVALENNPYIDEILDVNMAFNHNRYFAIIDISTPCAKYESTRISTRRLVEKSRVEVFAEALGTRNLITDIRPRFYLTEKEKTWGKAFLKEKTNPKKKTILIGINSAEKYRNWTPERLVELCSLLKNNFNIIITGKEPFITIPDVIDICGIGFRKTASILSAADGLVSVDTSLIHLSAVFNIPTVALFGPIDYKARCKGYKNITVINTDLPCIPCWRNGIMKCKQTNKVDCYSMCMEKIQARHVAKIVLDKFKKEK